MFPNVHIYDLDQNCYVETDSLNGIILSNNCNKKKIIIIKIKIDYIFIIIQIRLLEKNL